jgi:kinesin family protein 5
MRAKSIKNTARINVELSPSELKGLLKKAQSANASFESYIAALEAEVAKWRNGGTVDQSRWATAEGSAAAAIKGATKKPSSAASPTPSTPRPGTPVNPLVENLRGDIGDSRPQTPTVFGVDKDEREEFLRRENELTDQLAEKASRPIFISIEGLALIPVRA